MKKIFVLLTFLWWIPLFSQVGTVKDNLSLESKILNGERKYAIYLPPDYEFSERNYPVLYLLHGSGDDQTGWVQFGEVLQIADKAILQGNATSMIIVMPDANSVKKGYFNSIDKVGFLSSEFILKSLIKPSFFKISAIFVLKLEEGNSTFL